MITKFVILFALLSALFVVPVLSQENGLPILLDDPITLMRDVTNMRYGTLKRTVLNDQDSIEKKIGHALRCEVTSTPPNAWNVQFRFPISLAVKKNTVMLARFHARVFEPGPEVGEGVIRLVFERSVSPYNKSLNMEIEIGREWKEYFIPFKADDDYGPGQASTGVQFGFQEQTVEIADFTILSYGLNYDMIKLPRTSFSYEGREQDAPWRNEAKRRIEKIRKGDLMILVQDRRGNPISGADVEIRMKRHAFAWGAAVTSRRILENGDDGDQYRKIIESNFTRVVFENDLKWLSWDNRKNHERILKAVRWLRDRNIDIRGHCLVWPSWKHSPNHLINLSDDPEKLRQIINIHIVDEVTALRGLLLDWDVVNEPYTNNDLLKILGEKEMIAWFKLVHEHDPDANLYLNDYSILSAAGRNKKRQDHFERTLRFLKENGAPISGLGIQAHFVGTATPPERMLEILDRFSRLDLTISITEHDIMSMDEAFQADFTRDFLITMFSHLAVEAVLTWGFWENAHWRPDAAYYRSDWSITPAGQAWLDLVTKEWWTNFDGQTDSHGKIETRGFLGNYEINVRHDKRSLTKNISVKEEETAITIIL